MAKKEPSEIRKILNELVSKIFKGYGLLEPAELNIIEDVEDIDQAEQEINKFINETLHS